MTSSIKRVKEFQINLSEEETMLSNELEEILCELFYVLPQEGTYDYFEERSIYDLADEKELELRRKLDLEGLLNGEPEVEDLVNLELRAKAYFDNPSKVYVPVETDLIQFVTGYIQVMDGINFLENGEVSVKWKSIGLKMKIEALELYEPDLVVSKVKNLGVELNEFTRIVFYGNPLKDIVGEKIYSKGETKKLVELCPEYSSIVIAVPDYEECSEADISIYESIDCILKEEIPIGGELEISRVAMGHYWMTKQRLEELKEEEKEYSRLERIKSKEEARCMKFRQFNSNFEEARKVINYLNNSDLKVSDFKDEPVKLIAQVLYLAEKQGERIENKFTYFGLKSLLKKLKAEDAIHNTSTQSVELIRRINKGETVEVHLLDYQELEVVMNLLWSGASRIDSRYKDVYFSLKERFNHLKKVKALQVA